MRQALLYRPEKDKSTGDMKLAKRLLDPSEELDALAIHKKTGSSIKMTDGEVTITEGEFDLSSDEKKMLSKFVRTFPVSAEVIEAKASLIEKIK